MSKKEIISKCNSNSPQGLGFLSSLQVLGVVNLITNVKDLGNLQEAIKEALEIKKNRLCYKQYW
jgi:hypothetical protein